MHIVCACFTRGGGAAQVSSAAECKVTGHAGSQNAVLLKAVHGRLDGLTVNANDIAHDWVMLVQRACHGLAVDCP